ncbi:Sec-independent protein translocase TatA [Marinicauda algicola]|uniref:Sec-independent protein translocase protein TatA n=1 Tax=Marinicauda algicola TaxID=2029849 RepID=A0A4S2GZZ2_9PROT|nr:twin-arginine translocase TatA/TatE family subunit [Marinicauda algicola]TGY88402.1 Sec-independent protein translocase TatA [Marinicauda algicola]
MAPHWTGLLIVAILLLLLFGGRGKISSLMGDFAKGITAFRKGLKDEDADKEKSAEESGRLSRDSATGESERTSKAAGERTGSNS